jgi:hypothetical protein
MERQNHGALLDQIGEADEASAIHLIYLFYITA